MTTPTTAIIKASTPIVFCTLGAAIILGAIFAPNLTGEQRAYGIGAGGAAISGGCGIAKQDNDSTADAAANVNLMSPTPLVQPDAASEEGYVYEPPSLRSARWQEEIPQPNQRIPRRVSTKHLAAPDDE